MLLRLLCGVVGIRSRSRSSNRRSTTSCLLAINRHAFDVRPDGHGSPTGRTTAPKEPTAIRHGSAKQVERLLPQANCFLLHSSRPFFLFAILADILALQAFSTNRFFHSRHSRRLPFNNITNIMTTTCKCYEYPS